MTRLVVRLLGGFRVELDAEAVYDFETDKARGLLAYLVVEAGRPHRRESLASLLWPDRPDTVARANLRHTLSALRRALGGSVPTGSAPPGSTSPDAESAFLFITRSDVQFNTASDYTLDVAELEAFTHTQLLPEALCADFLAGFAVPDSEAFQAWVLSKQEYFHRLAIETLNEQNAYFESVGDFEQALAAARLQLQLEPWLEEAHRRCMRGLALAGRRDEALHQYEACRRTLEAELGVEPADSTQALVADLREGKIQPPQRPVRFGKPDRPGSREESRPARFREPDRSEREPVPLVAREDELGQLGRHLDAALAGATGVAFVSGDAGSGKTSLVEAFARWAMAQHPDLLVAGARCSPGLSLDAFALLRRLAEMLFGDLGNAAVWRLAGREQVDRLQAATDLALSSLAEHGPDLVGVLVGESSVARRAGDEGPATNTTTNKRITHATRSYSFIRDPIRGRPTPLSQGVLFDQLTCTLAAIARDQPLLLLFDDLHWVDDASAAFLLHLGRELGRARLLVLGAYRSATVSLGRRDPQTGEMARHPLAAALNELRRVKGEIVVELDRCDGRAFVEEYVDTEPNRLGARFRDALYAQTGGHALFTVETLRNLQERGVLYKDEAGRWISRESLDWGELPVRVEAAIAERIERLPDASRRLLSAASVQGDSFSAEVVAEVNGGTVAEVLASLGGSLARQHGLVRPEGSQRASAEPRVGKGEHSVYRFSHHLFQKYLYDQLDPFERTALHRDVAIFLDAQVGEDEPERERLAARLAWHYEQGGLPLPAARALLDAGHQAMRVSAFREALARFDHGLTLLDETLPSAERAEIAALLEVARLGPERNLEGIGTALHRSSLARATAAWAGRGGPPQFMLLLTEAENVLASGRFEKVPAAAERLRAEAVRAGDADGVGLAHLCLGMTQAFVGNLDESERGFDRVLEGTAAGSGARLRAATGIDLEAQALAFSALNWWLLGRWEQALARSQQAIVGARASGAAVGHAASLVLGAQLLFLLRVHETADAHGTVSIQAQSEQALRLCLEQGIGMWRPFSEVLLGRLMVQRGEDVAGIERMRGALAGWQAVGMRFAVDRYVVVLADGCLAAAKRHPPDAGEVRESLIATGLAAIEDELDPARVRQRQAHDAELHRLRGELLLARDGLAASEEALACFRRAMDLGRDEGALAWELRAAMSVVRLLERAPHLYAFAELQEARGHLAAIYGRFTEGFSFRDLREAAALLHSAGHPLD